MVEIRLTQVRAIKYQMPLKRAYGTARGVTSAGVNFLFHITAETGVTADADADGQVIEGVGECQPRHALTGDGGKDRAASWQFVCAAADKLAGRRVSFADPESAATQVRALLADLQPLAAAHAETRDRERPFRGTLLGIEVALLDVVSRALGLQIADVLGRQRDDIGISISTISSSNDLDAVWDKTIKQVRFPMTRVKGIGDIAYDLQLLDTVTRANRSAGREKPLWIDINEALDYHGAVELLSQIAERMGTGALPASLVVEGILPKADVDQLPALQRVADEQCRADAAGRALDLRIMPDEGLWDVTDLARLNQLGGCRAINIKAPKAGGLLASLDLANAAVAADPGVHICIGGMVGTSDITAWALHNLARALPRVDYLTTVPPQNVQERIAEPLARYRARGSNIIAAQTLPGLGSTVRAEKLRPYIGATHDAGADGSAPAAPARVTAVGASGGGEQESPGATTRTLVFGGDTSLGDVYVNRQGGALRHRLEKAPMSFLDGLRPLLDDHDELVLNLETVLAESPASPFEGKKSYLGWDSPSRTIDCLKALGVGAVSLANNHTMDFGAKHLLATRERLVQAGIRPFGAGANREEAADPLTLSFEFDGFRRRVHILGAMQLQPKLRDEYQFYAGADRPGVHSMAISQMTAAIEHLRSHDPTSLIVLFPHWGRNYQWANDAQLRAAEAFTAAGADLIIGHGAHMLQQCSFGERHAVVYSLGNFQFNWGGRFDKYGAPPYGLVARVGLGYQAQGWTVDLRLYPIVSDNRANDHRPAPVDESAFDTVWDLLSQLDVNTSFQRLARRGRDNHGLYIAHSFDTRGSDPQQPPAAAAPPSVAANSARVTSSHDGTDSVVAALATRQQLEQPAKELLQTLSQSAIDSFLLEQEALLRRLVCLRISSTSFLAGKDETRIGEIGYCENASMATSRPGRSVASSWQHCRAALSDAALPVPRGRSLDGRHGRAKEALREVGYPVVVRPASDGRYVSHTLATSEEELIAALSSARDQRRTQDGFVVERHVAGKLYSIFAVGERGVAVISRDDERDVTSETHPQLLDLAGRAVAALPGVDHASIEIAAADHRRPLRGQSAAIVGVDTSPALSLFEFPRRGPGQPVAALLVDAALADHASPIPRSSIATAHIQTRGARMLDDLGRETQEMLHALDLAAEFQSADGDLHLHVTGRLDHLALLPVLAAAKSDAPDLVQTSVAFL